MNFKRGIAPTEAMGVGQVAIAPVIKKFFILNPTRMVKGPGGKAFPGRTEVTYPPSILQSVEEGISDLNPRFLAFTTGTEIDEYGNDRIYRLSEYKGLFLKYGDRTYKIPKG